MRILTISALMFIALYGRAEAQYLRWYGGIYGPGVYRSWYWHRPGSFYNPGDFYFGWGYRPSPRYYYGW